MSDELDRIIYDLTHSNDGYLKHATAPAQSKAKKALQDLINQQVLAGRKDNLEQALNRLPAYIHDEDEKNRLFLFISRDIKGDWNASYETEGRHYHATTTPTLLEAATKLKESLERQDGES